MPKEQGFEHGLRQWHDDLDVVRSQATELITRLTRDHLIGSDAIAAGLCHIISEYLPANVERKFAFHLIDDLKTAYENR